MSGKQIKKTIKVIKVNADLCTGCRVCEMICSAYHADPKYSRVNPERSRIRVIRDPISDRFIPVFAGAYTPAECIGRDKYIIDGKEYEECAFCRAACPSRELFKEPDSGLPLNCDRCEGEEKPLCVTECYVEALTFEEREVEDDDEVNPWEMVTGLESLADRYGLEKIREAVARIAKGKKG